MDCDNDNDNDDDDDDDDGDLYLGNVWFAKLRLAANSDSLPTALIITNL